MQGNCYKVEGSCTVHNLKVEGSTQNSASQAAEGSRLRALVLCMVVVEGNL